MLSVTFGGGPTRIEYRAQSIGRFAFETLSEDRAAAVVGVTSRGLFIRTDSRWLTFVSFEKHRGPCTLTLEPAADCLRAAKIDTPAQIVAGKLRFPSLGIGISALPDAVWRSPPPSGGFRPREEQLADLKYLVREAAINRVVQGPGSLALLLLGLEACGTHASPDESTLADVSLLRQALADGHASLAAGILDRRLGQGRGLTPAWDDFVAGLLLLLNRGQGEVWPDGVLQDLNRRLVAAAYERTTRLSANLIECAALGESDERLLNVVDCILTGSPPVAECLPELLTWGSSSGVDAFAGMAVATLAKARSLRKGLANTPASL